MPKKPPELGRRPTKAKRKELKLRYKRFSRKLSKEDITRSKVVWKQIEQLSKKAQNLVLLYMKANHVEHLPNGIPYAVLDNFDLHLTAGRTFTHVSMPIILISSNLSPRERQEVARHEYLEWATGRSGYDNSISDSHNYAVAKGDDRIREGILSKLNYTLNRERAVFRERHLRVMAKKENKAKFREFFRKIANSKHSTEVLALEGLRFILRYNRQERYFDIFMALGNETAGKLKVTLKLEPDNYCHLGRFNYPVITIKPL